ncbi:hypothetical protein GS03_00405 [Flavobacterium sangjuense]|uniref:Uncharacterized protein n=1 Tax=Flavobacterium sangjuense TaxID=2518177 RepID=A0A4P7PS14_9FLAO|nr:hypothetical protein GS03_00405 [Flavobacterium sangjuense]
MVFHLASRRADETGKWIANIPKPFAYKQLFNPNFTSDNHWDYDTGYKGRND